MARFKTGTGARGLGHGKSARRHRKLMKDNLLAITKGDIRRLARRGGIKRISATIYDDLRDTLKNRLRLIVRQLVDIAEHCNRRTIRVTDVIFVLNRLGSPIYGFGELTK